MHAIESQTQFDAAFCLEVIKGVAASVREHWKDGFAPNGGQAGIRPIRTCRDWNYGDPYETNASLKITPAIDPQTD
ncbi:hypothetical protein KMM349_11990 [Stenotrophomonas maltophilia]|nr:hypothetical protein KMM349_11990 [Stenotrophomonas maltophilia]